MQRCTRIVVTLGPATDRPGVLEEILRIGLDVARINFSHGRKEEHLDRIGRLRKLAKNLSRPVAVLADLPGPKLRVLLSSPLTLAPGQHVTLALGSHVSADLQVTEQDALQQLQAGHRVLLDDGRLILRVENIAQERAVLKVENGGTLLPNKGINLPDTHLTLPALTARDREALAVAAEAGVDWLALSFVRQASAAQEVREAARVLNLHVPILAKIERPEAVQQAEEILETFDAIMVARGDLGVEIPLAQVPHVQKRLITLARQAGKPVITATDMLDSMRTQPRPTRAEASDVANAVYDGTDAVMLSGETSVGQFPVEAVHCMARIIEEAEAHQMDDAPREIPIPRAQLLDHITHLTCSLAREVKAQAILAPTVTGRTARLVARHRPRLALVVPSAQPAVLRQLSMVWGVRAVPMAPVPPGEDRLQAAVHAAFAHGAIQTHDLAVVLAGHPIEGGERFPNIRLVRIGEKGESLEP